MRRRALPGDKPEQTGHDAKDLEVLPCSRSVAAPPHFSPPRWPPPSWPGWSSAARPPASRAAAADKAPTAKVWVTTPDGTQRLAPATGATFRPGGSDQLTITVDPSRRYQTMRGFGASITDSSAVVLYRLPPHTRDAVMADLFDPRKGDSLNVLRQPMGASDFVAGDFYTYDDVPAGQTDYAMKHFSIAHDRKQILPLLRQALRLNRDLTVVATPWSPPAWMKTNGSLIGGRLIDDPEIYRAYARYFVKFVQAYREAGVPVHAVTLQNEPQNRNPSGYPGADMPAWQQVKLAAVVGAAFDAARLDTLILGYDHNWSEHPNDIATTPPGEDPETDYPYRLLRSPQKKWFDGIAYHCYAGEPADQTKLHHAFPDTELWFTECSGSHGPTDPPAQVFSDTLKWHSRNLVLGVTRNWGSTVVNWNLALDPSGGPHNGGCDTCTGVVTVGPGHTVTRNAEYYTLGHLARFVRPGAHRIASTSFGTTGWNGQVMDVAFRNPDGSTVLVVHNENDDPRSFAVAQGGQSFDYTLPGGSLATFVWPKSKALDDGYRLLDLHGAVPPRSRRPLTPRTSSTTTPPPGGRPARPSSRVSACRSTSVRCATYAGSSSTPARTSATTRAASPCRPAPTASPGGRRRSVAGSGQLTVLDLPRTRARYLRIDQTATASSWWSVADLRVYS